MCQNLNLDIVHFIYRNKTLSVNKNNVCQMSYSLIAIPEGDYIPRSLNHGKEIFFQCGENMTPAATDATCDAYVATEVFNEHRFKYVRSLRQPTRRRINRDKQAYRQNQLYLHNEGGWSNRPCHRGLAKGEPLNAGVRPAAGPGVCTPSANYEGGESQDSRVAEPRSWPKSGQLGGDLHAEGGSDPRRCSMFCHPGNRFLYRGRARGGGATILPIQPGFINGPAARASLCPK